MKRLLIVVLPLLSALLASCGNNILNPSSPTSTPTPTYTPTPSVTLADSFIGKTARCLLMDSQNDLYVDLQGSIAKVSSSGVTSTVVANSANLSTISHGFAYDGTYFYQTYYAYLLQVSTNGNAVSLSGGSSGINGAAVAPNNTSTVYFLTWQSSDATLGEVPASNFSAAATQTFYDCGAVSNNITSLLADGKGNYYYGTSCAIMKYNGSTAVTVAGTGTGGFVDGPAASAKMETYINGLALDSQGNLYFTDSDNNAVRELTAAGQVKTLVGIPNANVTPNVTQSLTNPWGIAVDSSGNVYFTDSITGTGLVYKYVP